MYDFLIIAVTFMASCSVRNKVSEFLQCCGVKTTPYHSFRTLKGGSSYWKILFIDHNLTNSCRKCSCRENVLCLTDWSALLWSFRQITNMALVKSRGWQNC